MKGKIIGFALALLSVATIGVVQLQTKAYVDTTRDCDQYAVIYCGAMSPQEAQNKYGQAAKIFQHMGISKAELHGSFKNGVVYQNGNVVVNGKVVATNARMAARNMGGTKIPGTNAGIMSVSHMGSAQTAMVKFDKDGRFLFAVMKPCGNPATGHPTKPPKPEPKPSAECKNLSVTKLERTKFRFDANASVKNGAKVKSYTFLVTRGNNTVLTRTQNSDKLSYAAPAPGEYKARVTVNTTVGKKTGADCVKKFSVPKQPVKPSAVCKQLTVSKIDRTNFRFNGSATITGSATVSSYVFTVYKGQAVIDTKTVTTNQLSATTTYSQAVAGDYRVVLTVKTSVGNRTGAQCEAPFKVVPPYEPTPGVEVTKHVENVKYKRVGVNVEYSYQIAVTNTGETNLKNVLVTDTPEQGITLSSASAGQIQGNVWTHTIAELKQGSTVSFILKAKVPVYLAGMLTNTVCVDAPVVPGNPDDCDTADVDVPPVGKVQVCNPKTGEIITVDEDDADQYAPVDSPLCKEMKVCVIETKEVKVIKKAEFDASIHTTDFSKCEEAPVVPPTTPEMPDELPKTGAAGIVLQVLGVASLTGAASYYLASRRSRA